MRFSLPRFAVLLSGIAACAACNLILGNETGTLDSGSGGSTNDLDGEGGAGGQGSGGQDNGSGGQDNGSGGGPIVIPKSCEYEEAGGFCIGDCLADEGPGPRVKNAAYGAFTEDKTWMDSWTNWSTNSSQLTEAQLALSVSPVLIAGDVTVSRKFTANKAWLISGTVHVVAGVTLTIEPGTLVMGDKTGTLVISRGGRIDAQGTATKPIVFTSSADDGDRAKGQWGGIVLLGRADNFDGPNVNVPGLASDVLNQHGPGTTGEPALPNTADDTHDCGTLEYVRIEFSGAKLLGGLRINGLTVGSCGTQTSLSHVQVNTPGDDGFEFFGGTFDAEHLVVNNPGDDIFDFDLGWRGTIDTFFGRQIKTTTLDPNGLEWDSSNVNPPDGKVVTEGTATNGTLCGTGVVGNPNFGALLRTRVTGSLDNLAIMGFDAAFDVRDNFLEGLTSMTPLVAVENSAAWLNLDGVAYVEDPDKVTGTQACDDEPEQSLCDDDDGFDEAKWFLTPANANEVLEP